MVFSMIAKMFIAAAPYILFGFILSGLLHQWMPRDLLRHHLGRRGSMPLLKAVGVGSLLPICSCGAIPLGVGLYRCGAAVGTVLAFMTSTPIISPVVVLLAFKLLGLKMAITLLGTAVIGSFLIGWLGNRILSKDGSLDENEDLQYERVPKTGERSLRQWFVWTFGDLGASVGFELVLGLTIATLVMALLPVEFISQWLGQRRITSLLLIILLSLPVYTCSVPSMPIVQSLLLLGVSPGAAVVYLFSGPATNMGELNAIRANMGARVALYYVSSLILVALTAGMLVDFVIYSDYEYSASRINGELIVQQCCIPVLYNETSIYAIDFSSVTWLEWGSTAILVVVVGYGVYKQLRGFIINPCTSCKWSEYIDNKKCFQKCHVRRKHEFFRKLWK